MRGFVVGVLGCLLLCVGSPESQAEVSKGAANEQVHAFFSELERDLKGAIAAEGDARTRLLARGRLPKTLSRELDRAAKLAREAAGMRDVSVFSAVIHATLWYGLLPVKQVEFHMLMAEDKLRLLRTIVRKGSFEPFSRVRSQGWTGTQAEGFRSLTHGMARAMTEGQCDALPRLKKEDQAAFLPKGNKARTRTRQIFKRFDDQLLKDCETLSSVPHHVTTMHLGEVKASIRTEGEHNVQLTIPLMHDRSGEVKLLNLRSTLPKGK